MAKRVSLVIAAGALMLLSACTTVTVNRFKAYSELGRSFEGAVDKVVDQAATTNIDANSQELLTARKHRTLSSKERAAMLIEHNEAVVANIKAYAAIKKQTGLLSDYFTALGALASFDGESAIGSSAGDTVKSLQALVPDLQSAKIGNASLPDIAEAAVPLIVSNIKATKLRNELARNGTTILHQLDLQSALLTMLADDIAQDQDVIGQNDMLEDVLKPFANDGSVPGSWAARRREILNEQALAPAPAAEAAELSKKLKLAFTGLVEGRLEPGDLADYATDLGKLVTLIELAAKPAKTGP